MSAQTADQDPVCGCLGCAEPAVAVIDHPTMGELVACEACAGPYEVVRRV